MKVHRIYYSRDIVFNRKEIFNKKAEEIFKKFERKFIEQNKKEIDKIFKILEEIDGSDIDILRYHFVHHIYYDKQSNKYKFMSWLNVRITTKSALSISKTFLTFGDLDQYEDVKDVLLILQNKYKTG